VTVQVSGIDRLYSAPLFVNYDPALLEFVDATEGAFLGQGGQTTVFSYSPNTATGQVVVGYKQGVGGPGASGDGSLFALRFRAKAAGTARVELNRVNFRDPAGTRLAVEPATTGIVIR
jgi:general secretion pathway protein D